MKTARSFRKSIVGTHLAVQILHELLGTGTALGPKNTVQQDSSHMPQLALHLPAPALHYTLQQSPCQACGLGARAQGNLERFRMPQLRKSPSKSTTECHRFKGSHKPVELQSGSRNEDSRRWSARWCLGHCPQVSQSPGPRHLPDVAARRPVFGPFWRVRPPASPEGTFVQLLICVQKAIRIRPAFNRCKESNMKAMHRYVTFCSNTENIVALHACFRHHRQRFDKHLGG